MAAKKSSKNDKPGIMDVSKPGKTPPGSTSKPIILNRKPMNDPMVSDKDKSGEESDESDNVKVSRNSAKVIQPLSTLGETGAKPDEKVESDDKGKSKEGSSADGEANTEEPTAPLEVTNDEKAPDEEAQKVNETNAPKASAAEVQSEDEGHDVIEVRRVEKKPDQAAEEEAKDSIPDGENDGSTEKPNSGDEQKPVEDDDPDPATDNKDDSPDQPSKDIAEETATETATVNAVASKARDRGAENKKAEEERKKQENIQHLIENKRYFLPIKHSKKHRRSRMVTLLILLLILLVGGFAAANGYLDISDLKLPGGYNDNETQEAVPPPEPDQEESEEVGQDQDEATATTEAMDAERRSDIDSIASSLEGYFVENDLYPTIGQLNNPDWRSENLPGLDNESLLDPEGLDYVLTESAEANTYAYQTTPDNCDNEEINCAAFELIATLTNGETYTKTSQD